MNIFRFIRNNAFLSIALFFLAFIPLYPKLPILDVAHTWVYIRIEDFLVALAAGFFLIQLFRKKVTLKTPLTLPIIIFWIVGAVSTLHAAFFLSSQIAGFFPQIALLHYLRHIEYLLLFFIGFAAVKDRKQVTPVVITIAVTVLLVVLYGLGQRYLGFPAFLTMNEEFAKGIPLRLSALSRVPSTFAGHYDLAAYLIIMIPVLGSMIFAYKKWWAKIFFFLTATSALVLLMMTASRVSFVVYLVAITVLLVLQKQKKFILPVIIASIILLQGFQGLSQRFASTITQVDLVVDARTGEAIGIAEDYHEGRDIVLKDEESTGENLPQGSKYINIPTNRGEQENTELYSRSQLKDGSGQMIGKSGNVIVKKAFAYDVSYTTRLQGTWPRAIDALKRNYLLGSGYSSISIASDNNYLRILGEIGIVGFLSFSAIFLMFFIYIWKILPKVENKQVRSFALGVAAGVFGLMLNAILIDVFEASKVAFVLWTLVGITVGLLHLYEKERIDFVKEMKKIFLSVPALLFYLFGLGLFIFSPSFSNYFVGDDFTWLRWAADCQFTSKTCLTPVQTVVGYFTDAHNFFYRPGTKLYFFIMFPFFEIFPSTYHFVSFILHLFATTLVFFILHKILGSRLFSYIGAALFMVLSVHAEAVYWISVTGHLVAYNAVLFAFLMFLYWRENRKKTLFALITISLFLATLFYEFAVVGPLLLIGYDLIHEKRFSFSLLKEKWYYAFFLLLIPIYYLMRTLSNSFWMQGDYSYSLIDLPFNIAGNTLGYLLITLFGTSTLGWYAALRTFAVQNIPLTIIVLLIASAGIVWGYVAFRKFFATEDKKIVLTSVLLFLVPLIPFIGFGNISPRYVYVSAVGVILFLMFLLMKLYSKAAIMHKSVVLVGIFIAVVGYGYFHITELKRINEDWRQAGEISSSTLTDLSLTYTEPGSLPRKPVFYFVNVPVKHGEAWVFPVGLSDAMWFTFRETPVTVKQTSSLDEAFTAAQQLKSVLVFEFLPDGSVVLVNKNPEPTRQNE